MNDELPGEASGEAGYEVMPSVGARLRAAREDRKMAVGDIAQTLKLGQKQVEALENGDWAGLPGNTFIRGFVRNYARLVNVDPAPLMVELDRVLDAPKQQLTLPASKPTAMPEGGGGLKRDYAMAAVGLLLVVVAAAIYTFMPGDLSALRASAQSMIDSVAKKEAPVEIAKAEAPKNEPLFPPGVTPQQLMTPPDNNGNNSGDAAVPPLAPPQPLQAQPVKLGPSDAPLHLVFQKESWVEVRDKDGKVLFSQRAASGVEQDVSGQGPFSLVVGYAPGVQVVLRGKPVDLVPHTRGDVARLTLE